VRWRGGSGEGEEDDARDVKWRRERQGGPGEPGGTETFSRHSTAMKCFREGFLHHTMCLPTGSTSGGNAFPGTPSPTEDLAARQLAQLEKLAQLAQLAVPAVPAVPASSASLAQLGQLAEAERMRVLGVPTSAVAPPTSDAHPPVNFGIGEREGGGQMQRGVGRGGFGTKRGASPSTP